MKLYKATAEIVVYFVAENDDDANDDADTWMRNALDGYLGFDCHVRAVRPADHMEPDWKGALVYGDESQKTVEEWWPKAQKGTP